MKNISIAHRKIFSSYFLSTISAVVLIFVFANLLYAADGDLDPTFDGDGKVTTDFGGAERAYAMAIQADGKIVVAGYSNVGGITDDFALARYNVDGSLDVTFDGDGKVITDFGGNDYAHAVVIQQDGKIVAAGYTNSNGGSFCGSQSCDFALARYNADGSLDISFDGDGKVTTDFALTDDIANAARIQSDGKIIAAGGNASDFALARYNSDGSLDNSFDGDGKVVTDFAGTGDLAFAVAIQVDGKIVAAGDVFSSANDFGLVRYNNDGSLDTSFDGDGKVTTNINSNDEADAVAIQTDGKIVAAGNTSTGATDFALVRYNADGSLDTNFDGDGIVTTDFGGGVDLVNAVAIQADGKIVAAGRGQLSGQPTDFALARYNADGSLDSSFNTDGKVMTDFAGNTDNSTAMIIQPDYNIVAAGYTIPGANNDFALARYETSLTNTPPVAIDDNYSTSADTILNVPAPGVLGNDSDANGDPLTAVLHSAPTNGTLTLNSDGSFTYTPNSGFIGSDSFTYMANDGISNSNTATVTIDVGTCTFCDDFEDGTLDPNWTYVKPSWNETGGNLVGTPTGRKAVAVATPIFAGCQTCSIEASVSTAGGAFNKVWMLGWYVDKKNTMELLIKEENDKIVLKQRVGGFIVAKNKGSITIDPNVFYTINVNFDGTQFTVSVNGGPLFTLTPVAAVPSGTVGFEVKNTSGSFGYIMVN